MNKKVTTVLPEPGSLTPNEIQTSYNLLIGTDDLKENHLLSLTLNGVGIHEAVNVLS